MTKRLVKLAAALSVLAVLLVALAAGSMWREHNSDITLPEPTGEFAVGRVSYTWANDSETPDLGPAAPERQVVVWIWYPAAATKGTARAEYLPAPWRAALAQREGLLMSGALTRDLARVHTHSVSGAPLAPDQRSYPVVIMRAGGGALTTDYTTLAEDLASHGDVVVGFDAPYRTFIVVLPDGRVIARPPQDDAEGLSGREADLLINHLLSMWVGDMKFVVNQLQRLNDGDPSGRFTGRLDTERLGVFGHSFGGAQALEFCHEDQRCKAGIDIDGAPWGSVVQEGLRQPFLFLFSDHSRDRSDPSSGEILANFRTLYSHLGNEHMVITIRGANHFSFSDQMLLKSQIVIGVLRLARFGPLGGRRGLALTARYVHTFFDVYLEGAPPALLTKISREYGEIEVQQP